jgi:hypothetical protein
MFAAVRAYFLPVYEATCLLLCGAAHCRVCVETSLIKAVYSMAQKESVWLISMRCVVGSWWAETEREARDSHAKRTPKNILWRFEPAVGRVLGEGYLHSCNWTMALPRDLNP